MRTQKLISLAVVLAAVLTSVTQVQAIENVRGKRYGLTQKHGPWMIMVTSLRNVRDKDQRTDGLSAEEAAAELVFELREKGIPAYTFAQDAVKGEIDTQDRLGREDRRIYAAQRDMICVLAGNYDSIDDKTGQKTLKIIKEFRPKFLKNPKSGAIIRADAKSEGSERGPLSGAFMTINPLVKPDEVVQKNVDAETKFMNSRSQFPLINNPHKFTLKVATFSGRTATHGNSSIRDNEAAKFEKKIHNSSGFDTIRVAEEAEDLARFIRKKSNHPDAQAAEAPIYDAYVYHDKFQSIVTIGGFDSADDPRIRTVALHYGPKLVKDFRLLATNRSPSQEDYEKLPTIMTTHTEQLFAPGADERSAVPVQIWTFDPEPQVIAIPRIK